MPEQVDECVESILDDPEKTDDESRAFTICNAQFNGEIEDEETFRAAMRQLAEQGDTDRIAAVYQALEGDAGQKSATVAGEVAPATQQAMPDVDPADPPDDVAEALGAEDFIVYGKASIEQFDDGGQNSDVPEKLDLSPDAIEAALDRFFGSEKAPGIISIGHDDIPVGRPLESYTFEQATEIEVGGETFAFDAGETITTHVEDADGDDRPELWLIGDLAKDSRIAKKARLGVLMGDLDGYSVTFGRKDTDPEGEGRRVTEYDLHAVTLAPDDMVAVDGAEFDLAAFKAQYDLPTPRADDTALGMLRNAVEELGRGFADTMSDNDTDIDEDRLLTKLGQKLTGGGGDDDASDDTDESNAGDDAGQKQPDDDEDGDRDAVDELLNALADEMGVPVADLRDRLEGAGQNADDEDEDEEDDDMEQKTDNEDDSDDGDDTPSVNIDFGAKLDEHDVVTEDDLEGFRDSIVDDIGEKLAEANEEAVEEIAQKMQAGQTPSPAGGSFQDEQDFESHLSEIAEGEGW